MCGLTRRDRGLVLLDNVESICGLTVEEFNKRTPYQELTAVSPYHRFDRGKCGELSRCIVDLVAPVGNQKAADAIITLMAALRKYTTSADLLKIIPA